MCNALFILKWVNVITQKDTQIRNKFNCVLYMNQGMLCSKLILLFSFILNILLITLQNYFDLIIIKIILHHI